MSIEEGVIRELIEIAATAPSEFDSQPWRFAIYRRGQLHEIVEAFDKPNHEKVLSAGALVIAFGDTDVVDSDSRASPLLRGSASARRDYAMRNTSLSAMLLVLAAHARGLATRPMAGFNERAVMDRVKAPRGWIPVVAIAIGHPARVSDPRPRERPDLEKIIIWAPPTAN